MKTRVVTMKDGNRHIHTNEFDADDALSSVSNLLRLGKIDRAYLQIIGSRIAYRVTINNDKIKLRGYAQPAL